MKQARFNNLEKVPARILRKMGYKADSQGIIDRFINVNGTWEGHLRHTRNFILKAVAGKKIENLAIYGSGWLLDLPLDELSAMAGQVWLYDTVHPAQIIHQLRRYTNVTAVAADITGGSIINAYLAVRGYKKQRQRISPEQLCNMTFQPIVIPDYTISLNLLSQIGGMISDYLKQYIPFSVEEIEKINCLLQQSHLCLLLPGRSCLITDVKELSYDDADQPTGAIESINCQLPPASYSESWEWQFDPQGGYTPGHKTVLQVVAIEF